MSYEDGEEPEYPYDAFDKREYEKIFSKAADNIFYPGYSDSYFESSKLLIKGIVGGELRASLHGTAATYLFRHYLELRVKELVLAGSFIKSDGTNAQHEEIEKVAKEHLLKKLWNEFCESAGQKIDQNFWNRLDKEYVENLILEFDSVDRKSMAFRYEDQPKYQANMKELDENLDLCMKSSIS